VSESKIEQPVAILAGAVEPLDSPPFIDGYL
jgi:hypothetical protein